MKRRNPCISANNFLESSQRSESNIFWPEIGYLDLFGSPIPLKLRERRTHPRCCHTEIFFKEENIKIIFWNFFFQLEKNLERFQGIFNQISVNQAFRSLENLQKKFT